MKTTIQPEESTRLRGRWLPEVSDDQWEPGIKYFQEEDDEKEQRRASKSLAK